MGATAMRFAGFDVETWGIDSAFALQPFRQRTGDAWITCAVFKAAGFQGLRALRSDRLVDKLRACLQWAALNDVRIVGWNTPYDCAILIANGLREEVFACKWIDAMLLYKHVETHPTFEVLDPKIGYGLKAAVARYLPDHAGYEKDVDFGATDPNTLAKLLDYNEADVDRALELADLFWKQLTPKQQRTALIEAAAIPMIAEAMVEGIHADGAAAYELTKKLEDDKNLAFVRLKVEAGTEITPEILASPKQLRDLIYGKWNLPVVGYTDGGAASTDREALEMLAVIDHRAKHVRDYREATNNMTKFASGTVESLVYNGDGCVRPVPRIYGTYTGRLTYSSSQGKGKSEVPTGIALHQWKRDPTFRKILTAPPGYTLFEFDFAGQEFRWMAVESGDPTMIALCQPGEDAHGYMGSQIRGTDYRTLVERVKAGDKGAKNIRQLGKVANLSLQYRTSAKRLQSVAAVQYGIKLTHTESDLIHRRYRQSYVRVPLYWKRQEARAIQGTYIENLLGRRVQMKPYSMRDQSHAWSYTSTAINYPIQSIGAEQKFLALYIARELLKDFNGRFYFELHDGIMFVIPNDKARKAFDVFKHALSNLPYKRLWGLDLPIQFPVDGKMGPSWGELREPED